MSLINDALKRARQAQQENPPVTPPLEFRPVEAASRENRRTNLLAVGLTLVIMAILGLSGLLVWFVSQSRHPAVPVTAREVVAPAAPPTNAALLSPPPPAAQDAGVLKPIVPQPEDLGLPNTNRVTVAIETPAVPPPPPLKLQGIFFNPQNPSAVVNGRTVYLGDRVNGARVIGISPVAVTLVSATETNVLSLSGQ